MQLAGIEPVRVAPLDPKSSASASSAIAADIEMVPSIGLEPITYRLQGGCSASWAKKARDGGRYRVRTYDLFRVKETLSRLS